MYPFLCFSVFLSFSFNILKSRDVSWTTKLYLTLGWVDNFHLLVNLSVNIICNFVLLWKSVRLYVQMEGLVNVQPVCCFSHYNVLDWMIFIWYTLHSNVQMKEFHNWINTVLLFVCSSSAWLIKCLVNQDGNSKKAIIVIRWYFSVHECNITLSQIFGYTVPVFQSQIRHCCRDLAQREQRTFSSGRSVCKEPPEGWEAQVLRRGGW